MTLIDLRPQAASTLEAPPSAGTDPTRLAPARTAPPTRPDPLPGGARPASERAPSGRDLFVDAIRALATVAVVGVHWLMADAAWDGRDLAIGNALATGSGWVVTWFLQVLAILFFAAGASAAYQSARSPRLGGARLLTRRLPRLVRPVGAFVAAWALAAGLLPLLGVPHAAVARAAHLAPQLLWFLAVYVALIPLTPVVLRAVDRWGCRALAVLVLAPFAVDGLRFVAGVEQAAWANLVLVWLVPYALGVAYVRGRLPERPGRLVAVGALALASAGLLIAAGPYPASMIGMPGAAVSNLAPPTVVAMLHGIGLVFCALAARGVVVRLASGRLSGAFEWVAARSMSLYLWHITAMIAVIGLVLLGLDERLPAPFGVDWWTGRPIWFGAYALVLAGLVRAFHRFEVGPRRRRGPGGRGRVGECGSVGGSGRDLRLRRRFSSSESPVERSCWSWSRSSD